MSRLSDFTKAVAVMRAHQKAYFALRRTRAGAQEIQAELVRSKEAERVVDWWLRKLTELEAEEAGQAALFAE